MMERFFEKFLEWWDERTEARHQQSIENGDHREGCKLNITPHCRECGWCEVEGAGTCMCYTRR